MSTHISTTHARNRTRRGAVVLGAAAIGLGVLATPAQASHYDWTDVAQCESSGDWSINTGNGYYGGLQFSLSTWKYFGGPSYSNNKYPHRATKAEQIVIAKRTAFKGWKDRPPQGGSSAWPNTWPSCD